MMDQELQLVELSGIGLAGVYAREDGVIIDVNGKERRPYLNGNVNIGLGPYKGSTQRRMAYVMAMAFIPNPYDYRYVAFKDGDCYNYDKDNLEWVYRRKNANEFIRNVRNVRIRELYDRGMHLQDIAIEVGVGLSTVCKEVDKYRDQQKED